MLYFGSFNPVHRAHIAIAEYVVAQGVTDEVVLVVSPQSPFKDSDDLAPEIERFEGVERAVAASRYPSQIKASAVEFLLPRPSYTIDTLRFIERECPDAELSLLVGEDNVADLPKWKEASAILGHYPIFVYPRGDGAGVFPEWATVLRDAPRMEISSTQIRALLADGREKYRAGHFGAALNDFLRVLDLAPTNAEAAGYRQLIDEILEFRNTDILNP